MILYLICFTLAVLPFALHELGHWLKLKQYKIPYKFKINVKKGFQFEFHAEIDEANLKDVARSLKVSLYGAVTPLLILIPLIVIGNTMLLSLGILSCLLWSSWTIFETWKNLTALEKLGEIKQL